MQAQKIIRDLIIITIVLIIGLTFEKIFRQLEELSTKNYNYAPAVFQKVETDDTIFIGIEDYIIAINGQNIKIKKRGN